MNQHFKPLERIDPTPMFRKRPNAGESYESFGGPGNGFEVFCRKEVLRQITEHLKASSPNEMIGLLAGRVCRDAKGFYSVIEVSAPGGTEEITASPGFVRISSDGNATIRQRIETEHPCLEIIGWFHSHPHSPPSYSSEDRQEQSTWSNPHCVGVVVSGLADGEKWGIYWGPDSKLLPRVETVRMFRPSKATVLEAEPAPRSRPGKQDAPVRSDAPRSPALIGLGQTASADPGPTAVPQPILPPAWRRAVLWLLAAACVLGLVTLVSSFTTRLDELNSRVRALENAAKRTQPIGEKWLAPRHHRN